jgi:uncharacterized RDD family membrane protein YckC
VIDGMLYTVLFLFAILACAALPDTTLGSVAFVVVLVAMLTVVHVAYFVELQVRTGQTPGKRIAGIKVVDAGGGTPSRSALMRRTIPLLIEYFYVLAFAAMMSSPYRQRLGDRWGHTYVVPSR